jgi:FdhD protein
LTPEGWARGERIVPAETPIAISFNGIGYAVMMATPDDLEDFAFGFALSERLIERADQVVEVEILPAEAGLLLQVELAPERREAVFERVRHRIGESSCGLCGIENLEQALRPLPRLAAPPQVSSAAIFAALGALGAHQPVNIQTGAVHAAALIDASGAPIAVREDVGRHNAFDKLIGALSKAGVDTTRGFAVITSRCSFEMAQKAISAGIPVLVAVSAPTHLAIKLAESYDLTLLALARADSMKLFAGARRIEY